MTATATEQRQWDAAFRAAWDDQWRGAPERPPAAIGASESSLSDPPRLATLRSGASLRSTSCASVVEPIVRKLHAGLVVEVFADPIANTIRIGRARLIRKLVAYSPRQTGWLAEILDGTGRIDEVWVCSQ